jgi:thiamine biosynthesis protein ThiI
MVIIVKYGEIALKGQNRNLFEKRLVKNIRNCLEKNKIEYKYIERALGRILIDTEDECKCLNYVYGINSFSNAIQIKLDLDKIKEESLNHYKKGTFRISVKRVNKVLKKSVELEQDIGAYIVEKTKAKVNLKEPKTNIQIEIFKDKALVYSKKNLGLKGLPVGIEGQVAVLLEDKDSIEAAKLMMKRGCEIILIKVNEINYSELKKYEYGFKLRIYDEIPNYVLAIVTSETLETLKKRDLGKPILRPLI